MARPRLFDQTRRQINMYLHNDQYEWLVKEALSSKSSPSAIMRKFIDAHRGITRDHVASPLGGTIAVKPRTRPGVIK